MTTILHLSSELFGYLVPKAHSNKKGNQACPHGYDKVSLDDIMHHKRHRYGRNRNDERQDCAGGKNAGCSNLVWLIAHPDFNKDFNLLTLPCSPKRNLFPANLLPVVFHQPGMHYPFSCRLGPFHLLHVRAKLTEVTHTHTCNRLILCFRYLVLFVIGVEYR